MLIRRLCGAPQYRIEVVDWRGARKSCPLGLTQSLPLRGRLFTRCPDGSMSEHLLNNMCTGPMFQKMGCKTVPQGMDASTPFYTSVPFGFVVNLLRCINGYWLCFCLAEKDPFTRSIGSPIFFKCLQKSIR